MPAVILTPGGIRVPVTTLLVQLTFAIAARLFNIFVLSACSYRRRTFSSNTDTCLFMITLSCYIRRFVYEDYVIIVILTILLLLLLCIGRL